MKIQLIPLFIHSFTQVSESPPLCQSWCFGLRNAKDHGPYPHRTCHLIERKKSVNYTVMELQIGIRALKIRAPNGDGML